MGAFFLSELDAQLEQLGFFFARFRVKTLIKPASENSRRQSEPVLDSIRTPTARLL